MVKPFPGLKANVTSAAAKAKAAKLAANTTAAELAKLVKAKTAKDDPKLVKAKAANTKAAKDLKDANGAATKA